jgi:hypothetical protein
MSKARAAVKLRTSKQGQNRRETATQSLRSSDVLPIGRASRDSGVAAVIEAERNGLTA